MCGKYIVESQKIMVNIIAISLLLLLKNAEIMFPKIAQPNDITITMMDAFGVLWKISIPISSIFCQIAVEIARSVAIGIKSRIYFFVILIMFGMIFLMVSLSGLVSKC